MNAESLEQAQSRMRLENQTQTKGAAEHSVATLVTSDLLTVDEAAQYLRISTSQLFDLTRRRSYARQTHPIPCIRLGKSLKFRRSSLDAWLTRLEREAG